MAERSNVTFESGGSRCAAWLYRPQRSPAPLLVLAHGLGAIKEMGLDRYAERFAAAGYAALVFDYRHFGESEGEPRQLLDIERELEDWAAALSYARTLDGIDRARIGLWGTSFGGGHAIVAGARDGNVAAIVSQCPFTNGPASLRALGVRSNLAVAPRIVLDVAASLLRRPPVRVKLAGPPGSAALMSAPDAEPSYLGLVPPGLPFTNEVAARLALHVGRYRPDKAMQRVRCPLMLCVCEHDSVAPAGPTLRAGEKAPSAEVHRYPAGHFDIYFGEWFERVVADQLEFLQRHLG